MTITVAWLNILYFFEDNDLIIACANGEITGIPYISTCNNFEELLGEADLFFYAGAKSEIRKLQVTIQKDGRIRSFVVYSSELPANKVQRDAKIERKFNYCLEHVNQLIGAKVV